MTISYTRQVDSTLIFFPFEIINMRHGSPSPTMHSSAFFKDRQQEARPVLVASQCNGDYYISLKIQYMYYIPFISLLYGLFIDIKYVTVT